jgi:hypothetical protein
MSMAWNHVSELRPISGLLFTPQVTYKLGEPWWSDVDRGKLLIRPPVSSLAILPTEPPSIKPGGSWRRKWWILSTKYLFRTSQSSLASRKILRHEADGFTSTPKEGVLQILITLKIYRLGRVWTHHYTTETTTDTINQGKWDWRGMQHASESCTLSSKNLKDRDYLWHAGVEWTVEKAILNK